MPAALRDVIGVLDSLYDPAWAESWDAVGLICGDPDDEVRRILFAVDPVAAVGGEALRGGYDLVVTHHPLFLGGVAGVGATTAKGRLVHSLIKGGVALFNAHTNADVADPGVSDALARALGLDDLQPLLPHPGEPLDKLVVFVPHDDRERLLDALAEAGAGEIGAYSRCAWYTNGEGTFRPEQGADPTVGEVGRIERVPESRLELVLPRAKRRAVVAALRDAHPYEEPAYDVLEIAVPPGTRGLGRVGELVAPATLGEFTARVARALPPTAWGVRAAGDPDRPVRRVAVCGGSGGDLLDAAARAGADVYVTADLRHHRVSEYVEDGGPALIDAAHWATEWPWLGDAAAAVRDAFGRRGTTVECDVSSTCTDPWTLGVPAD